MPQLSRRDFLHDSALSFASITLPRFKSPNPIGFLLVGTQTSGSSKGIYAYTFDSATGSLQQTGLAAEAPNPTFLALCPSGDILFAANELDHFDGKPGGAITSYAIHKASGKLHQISQVPTLGASPCHVAVDNTGRAVFAANYNGGSAASFTITIDGRISPAISFEQYTGHGPDPSRQQSPHAHRVTVSPDNRFLFVNDLGLDRIHIYALDADTARLIPHPPDWFSAPGAGPRALRFHPNGRIAYCVNEISSTISTLRWDKKLGRLETIQETILRPANFHGPTAGCDIVLDRRGRFAYAADRFDDLIVTFEIDPKTSTLTLLNRTPCGGKVPRHLTLDPTERWLLVANQSSDTITVLQRNQLTGQLTPASTSTPISRPQCLVFA